MPLISPLTLQYKIKNNLQIKKNKTKEKENKPKEKK